MKKLSSILALIILIIFIITLLFRSFSFQIALISGNYSTNICELRRGFDTNEVEFKIIQTQKDENISLLYMLKNRYGFWSISYKTEIPDAKMLMINWMDFNGAYDDLTNNNNLVAYNYLYYGINAKKRIEIETNQLPNGLACNVQQTGNVYIIHVMSYDSDVMNKFDINQLIKDYID